MVKSGEGHQQLGHQHMEQTRSNMQENAGLIPPFVRRQKLSLRLRLGVCVVALVLIWMPCGSIGVLQVALGVLLHLPC